MVSVLICVLVSLVAHECSFFSFDTMFTYITIAIQLYEGCLKLLKNSQKYKQITYQDTKDASSLPNRIGDNDRISKSV